jgi:hypothetical protein
MDYYNIVRFYFSGSCRRRIIQRHVSLEEAQQHCSNPETSSSTAQGYAARLPARRLGPWFDGYEKE